jgi:hypothetical protein
VASDGGTFGRVEVKMRSKHGKPERTGLYAQQKKILALPEGNGEPLAGYKSLFINMADYSGHEYGETQDKKTPIKK